MASDDVFDPENLRITEEDKARMRAAYEAKARKQIRLGDLVHDPITGFTGIAVARMEWLHGCIRWAVQSRELKDGKPIEPEYFDEPRLKRAFSIDRLAAAIPDHVERVVETVARANANPSLGDSTMVTCHVWKTPDGWWCQFLSLRGGPYATEREARQQLLALSEAGLAISRARLINAVYK